MCGCGSVGFLGSWSKGSNRAHPVHQPPCHGSRAPRLLYTVSARGKLCPLPDTEPPLVSGHPVLRRTLSWQPKAGIRSGAIPRRGAQRGGTHDKRRIGLPKRAVAGRQAVFGAGTRPGRGKRDSRTGAAAERKVRQWYRGTEGDKECVERGDSRTAGRRILRQRCGI